MSFSKYLAPIRDSNPIPIPNTCNYICPNKTCFHNCLADGSYIL